MNRTQAAALALARAAGNERVARIHSDERHAHAPLASIERSRPNLTSVRRTGDLADPSGSYTAQARVADALRAADGARRVAALSPAAVLASQRARGTARSGNAPSVSFRAPRAKARDFVGLRETSESGLTFDPNRLLKAPADRVARNGVRMPRARPSTDQGLRTRLDPTTFQVSDAQAQVQAAADAPSLAGGRVARILGAGAGACARSEYDY